MATFSADGAASRIKEVIPSLDREHSTAFRNYDDVWVERIPLLAEERFAKRRGGQFGETLRRSDHPDCAASVASRHFLMAQPPLLCEEGNITRDHT